MSFAKKQMEKMGWKEGKGLGKNEDGISNPIKLRSQFDSAGFGYDRTSGFNTQAWFAKIDEAIVAAKKTGKQKKVSQEPVDESTQALEETKSEKKSKKQKKTDLNQDGGSQDRIVPSSKSSKQFYKKFVKTECLSSGLVERIIESKPTEEENIETVGETGKKRRKRGLDIDDVFRKTKGVTCHRSAHVGLTLSGKMRRLQDQEVQFRKSIKESVS
jgi:hypothetical protein